MKKYLLVFVWCWIASVCNSLWFSSCYSLPCVDLSFYFIFVHEILILQQIIIVTPQTVAESIMWFLTQSSQNHEIQVCTVLKVMKQICVKYFFNYIGIFPLVPKFKILLRLHDNSRASNMFPHPPPAGHCKWQGDAGGGGALAVPPLGSWWCPTHAIAFHAPHQRASPSVWWHWEGYLLAKSKGQCWCTKFPRDNVGVPNFQGKMLVYQISRGKCLCTKFPMGNVGVPNPSSKRGHCELSEMGGQEHKFVIHCRKNC